MFQLGLCERELNNVLYGSRQVQNNKESPSKAASAGSSKQTLKQKQIDKDDVCPICQDDIYKTKKSLSFCKYVILITILYFVVSKQSVYFENMIVYQTSFRHNWKI